MRGDKFVLITRHIGIDLFRPRIDAAGDIGDLGKSSRAEEFRRPLAPHSAVTKDKNLAASDPVRHNATGVRLTESNPLLRSAPSPLRMARAHRAA